jgi:CheY-like chemotaxis protein
VVQALNPKHASVLLVEDSPNDQAIATRALKNFGIRHWHLARTAEEALKEAQKQHYDVVLVDYNLPGMNGLQLVEHLRGVSPDTRVIIVTGVRQESVAVAAMKLGVADYISKDEFLTAGITRSLQAALRDRVATADAEQRGELASRERELQTATIEAAWLVQALDDRHGYMPDGSGLRDPIPADWAAVVVYCANYLRASAYSFPAPATQEEDALLRALTERAFSPRDLFRIYVAALRELIAEPPSEDRPPIRPVLFLTHALACYVEELQVWLSVRDLEAPASRI